jgi:hypothetical protein
MAKLYKKAVEALEEGGKAIVKQFSLPNSEKKLAAPAIRRVPDEVKTAPKDPRKHPVAENLLRIPIEEMSHKTRPGEKELLAMPEITPEVLQRMDAVLLPAPGDRTAAGEYLTHVNEQPLENETRLGGGRDFGRDIEQQNADKLVWKSDAGVIDKWTPKIQGAAEEGNPVLAPLGGGWKMGDFSDQMTRPAVEMTKTAPITDESKKLFDETLNASQLEGWMPWPGIDAVNKDPSLLEAWLKANPGNARKELAFLMESKPFQDRMFPDIPSIRKAITARDQFDMPYGSGGYFYNLDPSGAAVHDPIHKRVDYSSGLKGSILGRMRTAPADLLFSDEVAKMRQNIQSRGRDPATLTMNNIMTGLERGRPIQKTHQQWVDGLMKYFESEDGKKLGVGGALAAGLMSADEAKEIFGYTGETDGPERL